LRSGWAFGFGAGEFDWGLDLWGGDIAAASRAFGGPGCDVVAAFIEGVFPPVHVVFGRGCRAFDVDFGEVFWEALLR
jgi:hypothetical protein